MVLINIDNLSDAELRYIGQQEDLEDWDSLSRKELIDALEELYGDDASSASMPSSSGVGHRFVKTLTDVTSDNDLSLPGVEALPETYNETSVHFILKDANWGYAFWSLSSHDKKEIEESHSALVVKTTGRDVLTGEHSEYEIDITVEDMNWNIELPWTGNEYYVQLLKRNSEGSESVLCTSEKIVTSKSWFSMHKEDLLREDTYNRHFASLVAKGGKMMSNRQVRELLDINGGDAE